MLCPRYFLTTAKTAKPSSPIVVATNASQCMYMLREGHKSDDPLKIIDIRQYLRAPAENESDDGQREDNADSDEQG